MNLVKEYISDDVTRSILITILLTKINDIIYGGDDNDIILSLLCSLY